MLWHAFWVISLAYLSFLLLTSLAIDVILKVIQDSANFTWWQIEMTQIITIGFVAIDFVSLMVLAVAHSFQFDVGQRFMAFTSKKDVDGLKIPPGWQKVLRLSYCTIFGVFVPKKTV